MMYQQSSKGKGTSLLSACPVRSSWKSASLCCSDSQQAKCGMTLIK
jgi:hypothetical protein